ncbi:MAG: HepT-like ribonuclease domain-containing protein [Candidatus Micrarchaeota archaeon]
MIDREQIAIMVKDVERYLYDLSEINIKTKEALSNKESYYAVSMLVFSIMNRVLDVGNEIISGSENIPIPGSYGETFELLSQNKIINPKLSSSLSGLTKYRNIIAHEYYRLTNTELFKLKNDIFVVQDFIKEIKNVLKK